MNELTRRKFLKTSLFGLVGATVASSNAYAFSFGFGKEAENFQKVAKV